MEQLIFDAPRHIDYLWLMNALQNFASPRAKITTLLKKHDLIRIKKGLYIPGPAYRRNWSVGVLANRIYGPSYLSYESALSHHGMIPERVENPTSAAIKKNRQFSTPVGVFSYCKIPAAAYHTGVDMAAEGDAIFLIATPEKAVVDIVARNRSLTSIDDIDSFLTKSLRIDRTDLKRLDPDTINVIVSAYATRQTMLLERYLQSIQGSSHE